MLYRVWLNESDEYPEDGCGWVVVLETANKKIAEVACSAFMYSYIEEVE